MPRRNPQAQIRHASGVIVRFQPNRGVTPHWSAWVSGGDDKGRGDGRGALLLAPIRFGPQGRKLSALRLAFVVDINDANNGNEEASSGPEHDDPSLTSELDADGELDPDGVIDAEADLTGALGSSILVATWALFVGLGLMLMGAGVFGTIVGVRSELDGFGPLALGLVASGYYGGFVLGSRVTLKVLHTVGHIRVFAALASVLAATMLATGLLTGPWWWVTLRTIAGMCLAGQYVVAESWLNQLVGNQHRGRLLAIYSVVVVITYGAGQWLSSLITPTTLTGFGIAAILTSLAVAPVALSEDARPPFAQPDGVGLRQIWKFAPTGLIATILVGVAQGAYLGLAAMYATRSGLGVAHVGLFVAMPTVGNFVFSVPISSLSDRYDRRLVGMFGGIGASLFAVVLLSSGPGTAIGWVAMAGIGAMSYPLYSIAGAYTNDGVPPEMLNSAASQLVLMFGVGAFAGPLLGSFMMSAAGTDGFLWTVVATHLTFAGFLAIRMVQYPHLSAGRLPVRTNIAIYAIPATAVGAGRRVRLPVAALSQKAIRPVRKIAHRVRKPR